MVKIKRKCANTIYKSIYIYICYIDVVPTMKNMALVVIWHIKVVTVKNVHFMGRFYDKTGMMTVVMKRQSGI